MLIAKKNSFIVLAQHIMVSNFSLASQLPYFNAVTFCSKHKVRKPPCKVKYIILISTANSQAFTLEGLHYYSSKYKKLNLTRSNATKHCHLFLYSDGTLHSAQATYEKGMVLHFVPIIHSLLKMQFGWPDRLLIKTIPFACNQD